MKAVPLRLFTLLRYVYVISMAKWNDNYIAVRRDKRADDNKYDTGKTQTYFIDEIYRSILWWWHGIFVIVLLNEDISCVGWLI